MFKMQLWRPDYKDLKILKDYLHYHMARKEYETKFDVATMSLMISTKSCWQWAQEVWHGENRETKGDEVGLVPLISNILRNGL